MLIATFNSATGWAGKTIDYDDGRFTLEGHGPISAADVLAYDRQGHVAWAYEGLREWVQQLSTESVAPPVASQPFVPQPSTPQTGAQPPQRKSKALKVVLIVGGGVVGLFVVLIVIGLAVGGGSGDTGSVTTENTPAATQPATPVATTQPETPTATAAPTTAPTPGADGGLNAAVLEEMRINFGKDVTAVTVKESSGDVSIDVYTTYYPDSDVAGIAGGMSRIAAQSSEVLSKYPSTTITAYVWPSGKEFYMTRTTASYTDGKLDSPMDNYVNDALK